MQLYIGNATRQIYDFTYKMLEQNSMRSQKIEPGTQTRISGNLTSAEIDYILGQHAVYGLIPENQIDRTRVFTGTCYSIDKPITAARLAYLMSHNMEVMIQQGREIRQQNALAQNLNLERALTESGRPERMSALDMTIQQENVDPKNEVAQFSTGTYVSEREHPHAPRPNRASRRRAAA